MPSESLEKLWQEFLAAYLKNVQKKLPASYRAQQMEAGGLAAELVMKFETRFLKRPFMDAMKKVLKLKGRKGGGSGC